MEKFTAPFEIKDISEGNRHFAFDGYASTFGNIDEGRDVVIKGAFADSIKELRRNNATVPVLWQHDHREPVGVFETLAEDDKGLFVHGIMPKDDSFVRDRVMPQMRIGSIKSLSIGYGIQKDGYVIKDGVRELRALKLYETSLVTFPMNPKAEITAVKSIDFADIDSDDIRALEEALKTGVKFSNKNAKRIISVLKSAGLLRDEQDGRRDGDIMAKADQIIEQLRGF